MELVLKDISKAYGNIKVIDGINVVFKNGIVGILGPNGAGKTTLFGMLTTNLKPDSGSIFLNERDIYKLGEKYRKRIGYMPQQQAMYPDFTAGEFLLYVAALKGIAKQDAMNETDRTLSSVGLIDFKKKKISQLSGGMKQRLLLAQSLLGSPDILILDEPTAGLDPKQRILVRELLKKQAEDKIILIATHIVSDVENVANQVTIIDKGHILLNDYVDSLLYDMGDSTSLFNNLEDLYTYYFGIEGWS